MALKFYDRTKEEATTTGTGTFSLSGTGADGGFRAFSAVHATGDEVFYCAVDSSNNAFEVGKGTLTSGTPWTLSRTEIKSSSNSNNKVNFAAAPEIFSTYPAENAAFFDTDMPNNVVETDAIFTDTLTADKALSGQFKGNEFMMHPFFKLFPNSSQVKLEPFMLSHLISQHLVEGDLVESSDAYLSKNHGTLDGNLDKEQVVETLDYFYGLYNFLLLVIYFYSQGLY